MDAAFFASLLDSFRVIDTLREDAMIAPLPEFNEWTMHRNESDFQSFGVPVFNPFAVIRRPSLAVIC